MLMDWRLCTTQRIDFDAYIFLSDKGLLHLMGIEADETYIGGKAKKKHGSHGPGGRGTTGKLIVAGAVSRKGNAVARVIGNMDALTTQGFVGEAVGTKVDLLATDEHPSYRALDKDFNHMFVRVPIEINASRT
jgi:hypothetical protein